MARDKDRGLPPLYLITPGREKPGEQHLGLLDKVEEALSAGVRMVQLREKALGARDLLELAVKMRRLTERYSAALFINDRVDVALLSGSDGVHLGTRSINARRAREVLGEGRLIGVSTHGLGEALEAEAQGADFITLGPVYYTPSKAPYGDPMGLDAFAGAASKVKVPVYALGGIKPENAREVMERGARGVAMISAVMEALDPARAASEVLEAVKGRTIP